MIDISIVAIIGDDVQKFKIITNHLNDKIEIQTAKLFCKYSILSTFPMIVVCYHNTS